MARPHAAHWDHTEKETGLIPDFSREDRLRPKSVPLSVTVNTPYGVTAANRAARREQSALQASSMLHGVGDGWSNLSRRTFWDQG